MIGTVTHWQLEPHAYGQLKINGKGTVEIRHTGALRRRGKTGLCVSSDTFRKPVKVGEQVEVPVVFERTLPATEKACETVVREAPIWIRKK